MDGERLRTLLTGVRQGTVDVDDAISALRALPYDDIGFAKLDTHRALRQGMPEVVFCQGKTADQVVTIFEHLGSNHGRVLGTRASPELAEALQRRFPEARYDPISRLLTLAHEPAKMAADDCGYIAVVCAGTADLPVAEEAAQTAEFLGDRVVRAFDVGVAGIHRLLDRAEMLTQAGVVISVAGMEGALTSVVGGLVSCPVIGVPTSVGYGASFNGIAALLAMLNSCAPGVAVVNIDNGFGAGVCAHRIVRQGDEG